MKKLFLLTIFTLLVFSCSKKENTVSKTTVIVSFTHNWDGTTVSKSDFSTIKFTNENGEEISIERLRHLISNIILSDNNNQEIIIKEYQLVDLGEEKGLQFIVENIPIGDYKLSFTFGFSDADNQDGIYQDLNTANFNVPGMLGGGYHYMQFDGTYLNISNSEMPFNYHAIRAVDRTTPSNPLYQDTSFIVNLEAVTITNNTEIEVKMNIAEWFKNPNTWNLNELNTVLMPNFEAQKLISANGRSVFSLGEITNN